MRVELRDLLVPCAGQRLTACGAAAAERRVTVPERSVTRKIVFRQTRDQADRHHADCHHADL